MELFKDNKAFENLYLLSSRDNKLLLNVYTAKEERWDIGKGKTIIYDIKSKSSEEIDFEFSKDYEKTSVICADFCGNGYVVSFAHMDSKMAIEKANGTKTVLTDANGKTIKYLKLDGKSEGNATVYRTLKSSPDGNKIIFSDGPSAEDVYMYDIKIEKTTTIAERGVIQPMWSKKHNSIYYATIEISGAKSNVYLHRYDFQ